MFITTRKGNLVPVTNIKMVTPVKSGGCIVKLKSGEQTVLDQSATEVLTHLAQPDLAPIVNSIMGTLYTLQLSIGDANKQVNTRMQAMENSINARMATVGDVVQSAKSSVDKLDMVARRTKKVAKEADTAIETVHTLIKELNNAIQEV